MSELSIQSELIHSSFDPITQSDLPIQKRKRVYVSPKDDERRFYAKKMKVSVWIGATLMQSPCDTEETTLNIAAFSVFYGLNDKRNTVKTVSLDKNQTLSHVYRMGVAYVLDNFDDNNIILSIHTAYKGTVDNTQAEDDIDVQINKRVTKRKGNTFVYLKGEFITPENCNYRTANKLAAEWLENSKDKSEIADSLKVSVNNISKEFSEPVAQEAPVDDMLGNTVFKGSSEVVDEITVKHSWAVSLNLTSLLDVLKSPFVRNKKN